MKKIKYLLAMAVVITLISTIAFAAAPNVSLNIPEYTGSGDLEVSLIMDQTLTEAFYASVKFDNTVWKYKSALKSDGTTWSTEDINNFTTPNAVDMGIINVFDITSGKAFIKLIFEPIDGVDVNGSEFYFDYASTDNDDCNCLATESNPAKVTVAPAQTPISPVAGTEIKVGNTTYTDVVNFASSVSGSGAKLSFDLFENGTKHGNTYSVNLADWGLTIEEGTLNFKVAIIGAPSTGVTMNNITLGN